MSPLLKSADWDFTNLPDSEVVPALYWEVGREQADFDQELPQIRAWLARTLSKRKSPSKNEKHFSQDSGGIEVDKARNAAASHFGEFISWCEFQPPSGLSPDRFRPAYNEWIANQVRPLVEHCDSPWMCLASDERARLCRIYESDRQRNIVRVDNWFEAIGYFKRHKPEPLAPLKFDSGSSTSVMLNINWRVSNTRILETLATLLEQWRPVSVEPGDRRGKKTRDARVTLERIGIMRLLHHYSLAEIKRLLPAAWRRYANRKWYDERRQALEDFRRVILYSEPEKYFARSWETKARATSKQSDSQP